MSKNSIRNLLHSAMPGEMNALEYKIKTLLSKKASFIQAIANRDFLQSGKRIRPGLLLLVAKNFASNGEVISDIVIEAALGIEILHIATLLHDDVVDDAKFRRGAITTHCEYGNKVAILFGDILIAESLLALCGTRNTEVIDLTCRTASLLAEGEMEQLSSISGIDMKLNDYLRIITNKTAALFATSAEIGAIVSDADFRYREDMRNFGSNFGIAFQIVDDIQDYLGKADVVGKSLYKDLAERKITLPIIRLIEVCDSHEVDLCLKWFSNACDADVSLNSVASYVCKLLLKHKVQEYCLSLAKSYIDTALTYGSFNSYYTSSLRAVMNCFIKVT